MTVNPNYHARTKHIEVDVHFVREKVASQQLFVKFISTQDQLADILTKPLPTKGFQYIRSKLTVCDLVAFTGA